MCQTGVCWFVFFFIHMNFCVKLNHSHRVWENEKDQVRKHLRKFYVHKSLGPDKVMVIGGDA